MKSLPLLLVVVLAGGATASLATYLLLENGAPGPRAAAPQARSVLESDALLVALQERVDELTRENAELSMRLATLENRPAAERRAPVEGFVARSEFEDFRDEIRKALAGPAVALTEPEDFREQVQGVLIDIRQRERFDKVRDLQEKRAERLDEDVQKIADWLELSPYQAEEMRAILTAQYDREDEVRRLWEAGEADEVLGERKRADREQFRADAERILTPEQYETFWNRIGSGKDG